MTTLAIMKARIADELARSDLTSQITSAITTAIEAYQTDRFFFNESRTVTFSTVSGQDFYGSAANGSIPDLLNIDWITILISAGNLWPLEYRPPEEIDYDAGNTSSTGQPYDYTYYQQQIRLYPSPNQVWTVRVQGQVLTAIPATDDEANNPWMTYGERLIRSRAKMELAMHLLRDDTLAATMRGAETEAFKQLKGRTNRQVSRGRIRSYG